MNENIMSTARNVAASIAGLVISNSDAAAVEKHGASFIAGALAKARADALEEAAKVADYGARRAGENAREECIANARLICRSVNALPEVVKALEAAREFVADAAGHNKSYASRAYDAVTQIDAVLSSLKAEG